MNYFFLYSLSLFIIVEFLRITFKIFIYLLISLKIINTPPTTTTTKNNEFKLATYYLSSFKLLLFYRGKFLFLFKKKINSSRSTRSIFKRERDRDKK